MTKDSEIKQINEETTATTEAVEEQTGTPPEKPTTSQPETTTPAATEEPTSVEETTKTDTEKTDTEITEQAPIETEQKQPGEKLTVKQKLADVPNSFSAKNEVMQLVEMGVIGGYPDAEFRPNLNINRD